MTQEEFRKELFRVLNRHMFMDGRDQHTINELLYVLEHDEPFSGKDFNISIVCLDGRCPCIPCIDAFVDIHTRAIWFTDCEIEFEVEKWDDTQYNCITIYESEKN